MQAAHNDLNPKLSRATELPGAQKRKACQIDIESEYQSESESINVSEEAFEVTKDLVELSTISSTASETDEEASCLSVESPIRVTQQPATFEEVVLPPRRQIPFDNEKKLAIENQEYSDNFLSDSNDEL